MPATVSSEQNRAIRIRHDRDIQKRLSQRNVTAFLIVYRVLVARGPAGSATKRIADEAVFSYCTVR